MTLPVDLRPLAGGALPPLGFSADQRYDPDRFEPPRNDPAALGKPAGGLWLSPLLATAGSGEPTSAWAVHAHGLWDVRLPTWPMALRPDATVLPIDSHPDFEAVTAAYPPPDHGLPAPVLALFDQMLGRGFDFEALAADYDALWLTGRGAAATRRTFPGLSTWDVESVLVLRAAAVLG